MCTAIMARSNRHISARVYRMNTERPATTTRSNGMNPFQLADSAYSACSPQSDQFCALFRGHIIHHSGPFIPHCPVYEASAYLAFRKVRYLVPDRCRVPSPAVAAYLTTFLAQAAYLMTFPAQAARPMAIPAAAASPFAFLISCTSGDPHRLEAWPPLPPAHILVSVFLSNARLVASSG